MSSLVKKKTIIIFYIEKKLENPKLNRNNIPFKQEKNHNKEQENICFSKNVLASQPV